MGSGSPNSTCTSTCTTTGWTSRSTPHADIGEPDLVACQSTDDALTVDGKLFNKPAS
jgi:hypothetical protein